MSAHELATYIEVNKALIEWIADRVLDPRVGQEVFVPISHDRELLDCLQQDIDRAEEESLQRRDAVKNWRLSEQQNLLCTELPEDSLFSEAFSYPALSLAVLDPLFADTLQFAWLLRQRVEAYHLGARDCRVAVSIGCGVSMTRLIEMEATTKKKSQLYRIQQAILQLEGGFRSARQGTFLYIYDLFDAPNVRDYFLLRDWVAPRDRG